MVSHAMSLPSWATLIDTCVLALWWEEHNENIYGRQCLGDGRRVFTTPEVNAAWIFQTLSLYNICVIVDRLAQYADGIFSSLPPQKSSDAYIVLDSVRLSSRCNFYITQPWKVLQYSILIDVVYLVTNPINPPVSSASRRCGWSAHWNSLESQSMAWNREREHQCLK